MQDIAPKISRDTVARDAIVGSASWQGELLVAATDKSILYSYC